MSDLPKVAVTVAEMARMCGLGRSRFYQLIGSAFPHPLYSLSTRRPFYDQSLQQVCLEVRRRNCGIDGVPILFYSKPVNRAPAVRNKPSKLVPVVHADLIDGLKALGMIASTSQIDTAIKQLYPTGMNGVDSSTILRAVFIHLQAQQKQ